MTNEPNNPPKDSGGETLIAIVVDYIGDTYTSNVMDISSGLIIN